MCIYVVCRVFFTPSIYPLTPNVLCVKGKTALPSAKLRCFTREQLTEQAVTRMVQEIQNWAWRSNNIFVLKQKNGTWKIGVLSVIMKRWGSWSALLSRNFHSSPSLHMSVPCAPCRTRSCAALAKAAPGFFCCACLYLKVNFNVNSILSQVRSSYKTSNRCKMEFWFIQKLLEPWAMQLLQVSSVCAYISFHSLKICSVFLHLPQQNHWGIFYENNR